MDMALLRYGLVIALAIGAAACEIGAPQRASDIQNVHAISDDIAAVRMTESPSRLPSSNAPAGSVGAYSPSRDFTPGPRLP
jgi:hypothetical protein